MAPRDEIRILTFGGGQDVGRSCVVVTLGDRQVMFDFGMHMGYHDGRKFPDVSQLGGGEDVTALIDCVFITYSRLPY